MTPPEILTSASNPLFKEIRRAQERGGVTASGLWVVEGPKLISEAVLSGYRLRCLVSVEGVPEWTADRQIAVAPELFASISDVEAPQGVLALIDPPLHPVEALVSENALIVVLDGIQDPGNAGAIARAAEAFGASGLVFTGGSARPLQPKALRASAGSLLRLPFVEQADAAPLLLEYGFPIYAAMPHAPFAPLERARLSYPCILIVGGEGRGIRPTLASIAEPLTIPTRGVESLNAAMAATVLLYEAARQRAASR